MIILQPELFPTIDRYLLLANATEEIAVAVETPFDKRQKQVHRYPIADVNGKVLLTVPIEKPEHTRGATWNNIRISRHNSWWNIHRTALESAYGRTPYFEFYIDRLLKFFNSETPDRYPSVAALALAAEQEICRILSLPEVVPTDLPAGKLPQNSAIEQPRYWQVRADKLGFIPNLSILDLIFSMGPEAIRVLKMS